MVNQLHRVGRGEIRLVQKEKSGHLPLLEKAPERLGVALNALRRADHQNAVVHHRQRPLHLRGKVTVSGRVEPPQDVLVPLQPRQARVDRDAPPSFERVRVQEGVPVVHPSRLPHHPRAAEHLLRERGLAGVHMSRDSDYRAQGPHPHFPLYMISRPRARRRKNCYKADLSGIDKPDELC